MTGGEADNVAPNYKRATNWAKRFVCLGGQDGGVRDGPTAMAPMASLPRVFADE
jgi:hypothetical protein